MCRIIWSLKALQSMYGWTPELSPIDTSCDRACKYADVKWKNLSMFLETQDMKPDTRKSRNHRIPWPHPVFFAKAAHKLDCPIIAHLRIFLVVVVYSYCLVFIVNNFENVGSLKWPIFTFLIMNIERIEPFFLWSINVFFFSPIEHLLVKPSLLQWSLTLTPAILSTTSRWQTSDSPEPQGLPVRWDIIKKAITQKQNLLQSN